VNCPIRRRKAFAQIAAIPTFTIISNDAAQMAASPLELGSWMFACGEVAVWQSTLDT